MPRLVLIFRTGWQLLAGLALAGATWAQAAKPAAVVDTEWRAWRATVVRRSYADPAALQRDAIRRYTAAARAGDLAGRVRALLELESAKAVADDFEPGDWAAPTDEAVAAVRASGDRRLLFDALVVQANFAIALLAVDRVEPLIAEQESLARQLGDPARAFETFYQRAYVASIRGDLAGSLELFQQAVDAAVDEVQRADLLLTMAGSAEWMQPDPESRRRRLDWVRQALELAPQDRYPYFGIQANYRIVQLLKDSEPEQAVRAGREGLALALRVHATPAVVAFARLSLARALVLAKAHPQEAIDLIQRALPDIPVHEFRFGAFTIIAQAHAQRSEADEALGWLDRAGQVLAGPLQGWARGEEELERVRSSVHAALGQWQAAYAALRRAHELGARNLQLASTRQAQLVEARHDAQVREQENLLLRSRQAAQDERRKLLTAGLVLAFTAALGLGLLAARQLRQKRALRQLGETVARHNGELQALHASRTRLLAAACHDLRQPAHALGLLADLAAGAPEERERTARLEGIRRCSRSLTDMLGMLMDLTRLEGGIFQPVHAPVSVGDLLREVELQFAADAARKGLHLEVQPSMLWVRSDRHLLRRIVFNLVSNAVRYTRTGLVTVEARAQPEGSVVLEVRDTGPGIPQEHLADVFSEYVRLDRKVEDGLGIGLPIVQRAAGLLGHPLQVQSEPGVGSCFGIELPQAPPGTLGQPTLLGLAPVGAHRLLLLLDDDEESLAASASLMRQWGFDVITAAAAEPGAAAVAATGRTPELLVTDLHLEGGLDGLDAVEAMRARWPGLRALLVTGDLEAAVVSRAAALGVPVGYKPLSPGRLLARIEDALAQPAAAAAPAAPAAPAGPAGAAPAQLSGTTPLR